MPDLDHARLILTVARRDLRALEGMNANAEFFDDAIFGFHAQQAVEKSLKAWLSLADVAYPRTHDLNLLLDLLEQSGQIVPESFRALIHLTEFAVQFRYEASADLDAQLDRTELTQQVTQVIEHIETLIQDLEDAQ